MQEKKKILIVSQHFWPENFRINDLVEGLMSRGCQVTILTGEPNYPNGKIYREFKKDKRKYSAYNGADIIRAKVIPRGTRLITLFLNYLSFLISGSLVSIFKLRKKKFDAIFVFLPSPVTAALPAILLKKLNKTPVHIWVLDLWPDTLISLGYIKSRWLIKPIESMVRFIYRNSTTILAQSEEFVNAIGKYCENDKVRYFPNWSEDIFIDNPVKSSELGDSGTFKILFAGNIGEAQDFESLLSAVKLIPDSEEIEWFIAGDGRYRKKFEEMIDEMNLGNKITLLGSYDLDKMPGLYHEADALYVSLKSGSNFSHTVPGKVQTYMASGQPILGMIDGVTKELIENAKCGVVCEAGNFSALAKMAIFLSRLSQIERIQLGVNGKDYYNKHFSKENMLNMLEDLLKL